MKKIICIGSATKDIFLQVSQSQVLDNPSRDITAKKLMAFEFAAKVYAERYLESVGGSAVNVAAGLTQAGFRSFCFSRVSKGETGKWILKRIGRLRIKKNYMQQREKEESEIAVIIADLQHKDHIIFRTGDSIENFDLKKALKKFREKVHWIFVASQKANWKENWREVVSFAKQKKAWLVLNPSGYQITNDAVELKTSIQQTEVIILNRDEAIEWIKRAENPVDFQDNPRYLLEKIFNWSRATVALTDGAAGAYAYNGETMLHLGITNDPIKETTGAGDAFSSGFLGGLIETSDLVKALSWGIANSGAAVSHPGGTTAGLLSRKELWRRGEQLEKKIKKL